MIRIVLLAVLVFGLGCEKKTPPEERLRQTEDSRRMNAVLNQKEAAYITRVTLLKHRIYSESLYNETRKVFAHMEAMLESSGEKQMEFLHDIMMGEDRRLDHLLEIAERHGVDKAVMAAVSFDMELMIKGNNPPIAP